jgi:aminoglycoside phosphotransferase (APT) family kinase protein
MQIPVEMRRRPPAATLAWAAAQIGPGARVTRIRRLRNSWAAAMHAIDVEDGERIHRLVLRRWARTDLAPDIGVVENEVAALGVLASAAESASTSTSTTRLPVPRLVAADSKGAHTDVPAVLMTRLPGRDLLAPPDLDPFLDRMVDTLRAIHEVPVPPGTLNYFRPWSLDTVTAPPSWSRRPEVWERAIEIAHQPVPAHERVLVHRDFWPGNVLWQRGKLTGVVDWTHACRGPVAADVAHCRGNLALLFGLQVADEFARRYGDVDDLPWHDIADTVSMGEEGAAPEAWRWHDAGRTDITTEEIIAVHDKILADAVNRIS